jgi:hypothetical protein
VGVITVYLPRELRQRRTEDCVPRGIFRSAGRNFPQSHCQDIGKLALFAGAHSLQSSIREMKDD